MSDDLGRYDVYGSYRLGDDGYWYRIESGIQVKPHVSYFIPQITPSAGKPGFQEEAR